MASSARVHEPPEAMREALQRAQRIVCIGHVNPDADSLGAMLGLARALIARGSVVNVALPEPSLSQRLAFLNDLSEVPCADAALMAAADTLVVVDTAREERCNLPPGSAADWQRGRPVLVVDHHITNTGFGSVNWVDDAAASTCEMVTQLIDALGLPIDWQTASLLYAGIYTDTVGFSLPTTRGRTLRSAARLVDAGADVALLGERLTRSLRPEEFVLLETIYRNTRITDEGQIAYSTASHDEIRAAGCGPEDIDDQVTVPRSRAGIRVAILFTEGRPGRTRLNFRGEGGVDVLDLAARFGGGGHRTAAGAILHCGVAEAVEQVLPAARALLAELSGSG